MKEFYFDKFLKANFNQRKFKKKENMTDQVEPHILKKYNLLKKVGSGAYGHVWKVTDKNTGQVLALKKIFDAFQHSTDAQRTYREIVFLHELNHSNIIKLYNVMKADNDKDLYLVFEYMEADLHNAIGQKILKDAHNRYILYQMVKGLKFMHSAQIIHRDLKPSNLLLNSDCLLKICDFGLARSLAANQKQEKDVVLTEQVATRWYRAPEVLLGSNFYDQSADIWSIGCILAQMLIGKPIFPGNSTLNQLQRILSFTGKPRQQDVESLNSESAITMINQVNIKQRPMQQWFKSTVPQQALNLVTSMLSMNPKKRPSASQILKHPYLSSFHKPREQTVSDKIIHPPISDNIKLNLKEYRKLIYERIKKLYTQQKQIPNAQINTAPSSVIEARKSIDRNVARQYSNKAIQKKYVHSQEDQEREKQVFVSKNQKIERPSSQNVPKKTYSSQSLQNSGSFYRNSKTNNSNYTVSKNVASTGTRNSSASNQKKTVYGSGALKHSSSSHHTSLHQCSAQQNEIIKKKNSLKQILKAKRQVAVESNYNVNPRPSSGSKTQSGFYAYNPAQVIMPSSASNLKSNSSQSGYFSSSTPQQSKYQNYTAQTGYGQYSSYNTSSSHGANIYNPMQSGNLQGQGYSSHSPYQHKQNKPLY